MGSSKLLKFLIFMSLLALYKRAFAEDFPPPGFHGAERAALLALRAGFNNSFLNQNWTSIMCYMNNIPNWYGIRCSNGRVTGVLLENLSLSGNIKGDALVNLTELSILSFKNNSISGNLMDFSNNQNLKQIDFSANKFDGPITPSFLTLNLLESLQLQENSLSGSIPEFNQSSLIEFNVSNNNLSGEIPKTHVLQSFNISSYGGNQDLCGSPSTSTCSIKNDANNSNGGNPNNSAKDNSNNSDGSRSNEIFVVVDIVGFFVVVFLFLIYFKKSRTLKRELVKRNLVQKEEESGGEKKLEGKRVVEEEKRKLTFLENVAGFELGDLLKASAEGLGKGNFGNTYKALLDDGRTVVVKRLRDLKPLSSDEFVKQLQGIADQKHPNLLPLLAYYCSREEKLLVYKFASNGNIFNRLHGGRGTRDRIPFKWNSRLSVARGVARALEYLHLNQKSEAIIPHGNLKSSNILLDENEMVLVTDYGLTSLIAFPIAAQRMVSYKSPEFSSHKKLVSNKSDVWGYGCLLLELLTGRVSSHTAPPDVKNGIDLCSWVHRAVREEWTAEIFDLEVSVKRSAARGMLRLLQIAVRCCDKSPEKRPEMSEVVQEVENIKVIIDSEDEEDSSVDQSLTDDSMSGMHDPAMIIGDER